VSDRPPRLAWLAPLLVGASAAIVAEVAIGILLYAGPGLMRSLTTVLGVEGAALAIGLWSAPAARPDMVDQLRRRWVMCLVAFLAAALFGTSWSAVEDMGGGRLGQGIGLAVVAAFPLYASGNVLGGMAAVASSDPHGRLAGPGAPAALGAGLGFIATGLLLPRAPMPASLLVACLVMLSLGGMAYGSVLGRRLQVHVRAVRWSRGGDVRVEDHRVAATGFATRYLIEGGHVRRTVPLAEDGPVPWDVAVMRAAMPSEDVPWRMLAVGGGASAATHAVLREHPSATVDVLERTGAVIELAREHLGPDLRTDPSAHGGPPPGEASARTEGGSRLSVAVGNLEDLLERVRGPYDLVLVDTAALAPMGGVGALSRRAREALARAAGASGAVVWGPLPPDPGLPELVDGWPRRLLRRMNGRDAEVLLVTGAGGATALPESFDGFLRTNGGPAPA
jgi:hypothetical protein